MKRVSFATLGCKTNQYDTECLAEVCRRAGFEVVPFIEDADAYIINTCTVTALADAQGRQLIRRARKRAPNALIIACGCSVQGEENVVRDMPETDALFGVRSYHQVGDFLRSQWCIEDDKEIKESISIPLRQSRARALLKIQDGCDKRCTFCVVWQKRGKSTSIKLQEAIAGYRALSDYPEVMLTGIHIGQYGYDLEPRTKLADLVEELVQIPTGPRIRLSSLDPDECDARIAKLISHPKVCRHVHLSVQSGSPSVLKAMGRAYEPEDVRGIVEQLVSSVPGIGIGMDLIAGFPGEEVCHHQETLKLIEELPIAFLHVFPFSARPLTKAFELPHQVSHEERKRRVRELIEVGREKKKAFFAHQVGTTVEVVVTTRQPDEQGMMKAISDNYIVIRGKDLDGLYGQKIKARIKRVEDEEVYAIWE